MVDFIKKRLQVFVSSTYTDLRDERQAAVEAILSAGHFPAGMELFAAGDQSQMEVIKQWIDESDAFLLILGGRYGSIEPKSGKSYIHLEYEYAFEEKKPLFACAITETALNQGIKTFGKEVFETEESQKFKAFRELVLSKMVKFWDDSKDIKIAISETLNQLARREDLIGWIRANQEANVPALADEIARLSKENSQLRSQLASQSGVAIAGLSYSELKILLQEKGVWDSITKQTEQLRSGIVFDNHTQKFINDLMLLGLLKRRQAGYDIFVLTDDGLKLINKLELENIATKS